MQNPTDELMNYMYSRVGVALNQFNNLAMLFRYDKQPYIWQGLSDYLTLEQLLIHTPSLVNAANLLFELLIVISWLTKYSLILAQNFSVNLQFHR